jgi:hypothetical protein
MELHTQFETPAVSSPWKLSRYVFSRSHPGHQSQFYVVCELEACGSGEVKKGVPVNKVKKSLVIMKNGKFLEQRHLTTEEGLCCRQLGFALIFLQILAFLLALFFLANAVAGNYLSFIVNNSVYYQ